MNTTTKLKKGDRVRVVSVDAGDREDGLRVGMTGTVVDNHPSVPEVRIDDLDDVYDLDREQLERLEKSLDNLGVGDVVVGEKPLNHMPFTSSFRSLDNSTCEYQVLAVLSGGVYALSKRNNFNEAGAIYTAHELKDNGFTIKDQPEAVEELTMEEVCQELGRIVKIKKS